MDDLSPGAVFSFYQMGAHDSRFGIYLYETSRDRNREQIERRTSNVQHRTLNIDDATPYRF